MAKLGIHRDFLEDYAGLERQVRSKILEAISKFEQTINTGSHLEKITHARDHRVKSIRIDQQYRGIVLVPEFGDRYTLLKVAKHDDAYEWARRRKVSVNMATGHLEFRDSAIIDDTTTGLARAADTTAPLLFAHVSDADLARLGIDEQVRTFARLLTDIALLEALSGRLPAVQYDVLIGLAAGMSPEDVWNDIVGSAGPAERYDPADIAAATIRTSDTVAFVDGPDELIELFRHPFARWRVYLHPTQREVAYDRSSGPVQVIGGPGTGKTVVAVHRARHLAAQGGRVLLTTFTSTLARSLSDGLRLLETDAEILARVDVRTVDQVARRVVDEHLGRFTLLSANEELDLWGSIIQERRLGYTETFLSEEWRQVVLAQGIDTLDGYLGARRSGRGKRLGTVQRAQVWRAIDAFEQKLTDQNTRTFETVCTAATRLLVEQSHKPYDHVIVDEAQDLHPVRWRLLRAAVAEGPDDLFITGDTHQRIYNNRVSLRSVGVHLKGRSSKLTVNYRTTAEILLWSHAMLAGERLEDLDGAPTSLSGCRSEIHGALPELYAAATKADELRRLLDTVRAWSNSGVSLEDIAIAARSGSVAQEAASALTEAGIPACRPSKGKDAVEKQIQCMTIHRMKGLEFRCVAVIGASSKSIPAVNAVRSLEEDEATHRNDLQRERCLLFVACTRAREQLYVSWHGDPSPFLSPAGDDA